MEDDRKLLSLPPYLCLAFIHGEDNELLTFCPVEENVGGVVEKNTPDLLLNEDYTIWNCCHGWLILSDAEDIHYSLWSPAETIHLPALPLNSEQQISYCLLMSPPGNSDSMVVLFETVGHSFFYCKVGDKQWTEQLISPEEMENPVMLDGRILFCNNKIREQGVGTIDIKPDRLAFSFFGLEPLCLDVPWEHLKQYLVESCGEIFSISMLLNGGECEWQEVIAVHVYKLDLSRKEWERVHSFKDRAFFLAPGSWFSCPATQTGIKGNHVYFQLSNDPTLYSYNMEDGTVLFSKPCPNLSEWDTSFWVIPNLGRVSKDAGGEIKFDPDDAGDEMKSKNREIVKHCTIEQGAFDKLPSEILTEIARCLGWQDYMRFRAVNTRFQLAAPIQRWRKDICLPWLMSWRQGDSIWDFIDPLHEGRYFITPNKEWEDITALTCYPKQDWCVTFHGKDSIFLWNPFSKKTIPLPNLHLPNVRDDFFNCGSCSVAGCNFSSSPDSSESDCTIVVLFNFHAVYRINFINLGDKEWKSYLFRPNEHISLFKDSPLVFYNGAIYFLDEKGNLGIYREVGDEEGSHAICGDEAEEEDGEEEGEVEEHGVEIGDGDEEANGYGDEIEDQDGDEEEEEEGHEDETGDEEAEGHGDDIGDEYGDGDEDHEVLDDVVLSPCESFHQKFLLECDGKLLSVFVGFLGEWVEIFSLDENDNVWVEVEDLGNHTIFISRFSAFSIVAPPGLQNRIYFPRFYGKNSVVYYSLESMQLHAHGMDDVFFEDFHDTKEQLLCGWITPRFLFMD